MYAVWFRYSLQQQMEIVLALVTTTEREKLIKLILYIYSCQYYSNDIKS